LVTNTSASLVQKTGIDTVVPKLTLVAAAVVR
jgi:hypothetical protein